MNKQDGLSSNKVSSLSFFFRQPAFPFLKSRQDNSSKPVLCSKTNKYISFVESMPFARPFAIAVSFADINPSIPFFVYFLIFTGCPNDESVLSSLFRRGLWFGIVLPGTEKAEFLARLSHHETRDALLALLSRKNETFRLSMSVPRRTSCRRACRSHHCQRHIHIRSQT
jgi:hypothetical protein